MKQVTIYTVTGSSTFQVSNDEALQLKRSIEEGARTITIGEWGLETSIFLTDKITSVVFAAA